MCETNHHRYKKCLVVIEKLEISGASHAQKFVLKIASSDALEAMKGINDFRVQYTAIHV